MVYDVIGKNITSNFYANPPAIVATTPFPPSPFADNIDTYQLQLP
jgi:hypothetical protein